MNKGPQYDPREIWFPGQRMETSCLVHEMEQSCIEYTMNVIMGRVLPDVRGGLKSVHRRILYAMHEDNLTTDKPFKKSATCVDDVLGRYHPHGNASVYDALVHLAQDFFTRYLLVGGYGNFGSIDDDLPAACRCTEARIAGTSGGMLRETEKDATDWDPNFDGSRKGPRMLPPWFPNPLVNGSSGTVVGMVTNIPSHNLREAINATICVLDNPEAELPGLMEHAKSPDFPTRGIIMGRSGTRAAYATGWDRVCVRACTEFEEFSNNYIRIIVTGIPHQVGRRMLIRNTTNQVEDRRLGDISDIRDKSDRNDMRMAIELRRDANPQVMLDRLFAQIQLQVTFAINMLALVQSGGQPQPKTLSLHHILGEYIAFQEEVIVRRTRCDLRKTQEQAHLLEDLLIVEDNIDAVTQTIQKNCDDAEENLTNRFGLGNVQTQATLDMQLRRLQGLEKGKLQNEYKKPETHIVYFNELFPSGEKIRGVLKDEPAATQDRYGGDRVTEIQDVKDEIDIEDLTEEEKYVFALTAGGYTKRTAASTYKAQRRGGKGITAMSTKEEGYVDTVFTASTHDFILFFTGKGRVRRKKGYQIPKVGRTAQDTSLVNMLPIKQDEKVTVMIHLREFPEDHYLVIATHSDAAERIQLSSIYTARKAGTRCIILDEGNKLIYVREADGGQTILTVTYDDMAICFKEIGMRCMGRDTVGARGINLRLGDYVVGAVRTKRDHRVLMITENGYGKRTDTDEYICVDRPQERDGFGLKGYNATEETGPIVGVKVVSDEDDVLVVNDAGVIICMAAAGISTYGRATQNVEIMNLEERVKVTSFARTDHRGEEEVTEGETPTGDLEQV